MKFVTADDIEKMKAKSLTGKFPVLETPEGHTLMEGLTIVKYFARKRPSFYGNNDLESKQLIISLYMLYNNTV